MTKSIHVSVIAPPRYLAHFVAQSPATVHHVTAQRVLGDAVYRRFFRREAELGATIIVDNGVFDLGESLSALELVEAARAVQATEIILPDVMHDGPATINASTQGAAEIRKVTDEFLLCAVVHAADDDEWHRCYDYFANSDYVDAIALPASRRRSDSPQLSKDRVLATAYLESQGLVNPRIKYRMLGLGWRGHLELFEQREHEWIESVDCAAPVILGTMGIEMLPNGPYEKVRTPRVETIEEIPEDLHPLIRRNIAAVRHAANCPLTIPAG
ncbi:hypothetical protein ACFU5Z_19500 [Streptomyces sp. NPDC057521]|uniref:hypothetical protein n=1 Tax=Streptomyces sp. NPDC057521 TaxID=3346156 RepID=UPI003699ED57